MLPPQPDPTAPPAPRERALELVDEFCRTRLPGTVRRLSSWKQRGATRMPELIEDVRQDLYVDALEHTDEVLGLDDDGRAHRWLRVAQRSFYWLEQRHQQRGRLLSLDACDLAVAETADPAGAARLHFDASQRRLLTAIGAHGVQLKSGRLSSEATAAALGLDRRRLREFVHDCAVRLGYDADRGDYWRNRLVEALLAAAAGCLLDLPELRVWQDTDRRRVALDSARRRFLAIRRGLGPTPIDAKLRAVLARVAGKRMCTDPLQMLRCAETLAPADPRVALWQFESAAARRDLAAAEHAIRRCELNSTTLVPRRLAFARLAELRGDRAEARRLLEQALGEIGPDSRLRDSLQALCNTAPARAHTPRRRQASSSRQVLGLSQRTMSRQKT